MFYQTHFIILLQMPFVKVRLWTSFAYMSNVTNDAVYVKVYLRIPKKEEESHWSFCYNRLWGGASVCVCVCTSGHGCWRDRRYNLVIYLFRYYATDSSKEIFVFCFLNKLSLNIKAAQQLLTIPLFWMVLKGGADLGGLVHRTPCVDSTPGQLCVPFSV